ncbi:2,3-bisphosphoglycerate-dependent phosphoglycerate mutase [Halomonadaceae bacterium LMG 33818]|uniref:histidine phosphatase family protein n=1 Tax=Cernens ardua TaxID=3402176 RepID=UPI003EDC8C6C
MPAIQKSDHFRMANRTSSRYGGELLFAVREALFLSLSKNTTTSDACASDTSFVTAESPVSSHPALVPKPFLFVRHGETFHNRARIIAGSQDVVLTSKGKQQAIDAGTLLRNWQGDIVVSSSQLRARQTATLALPDHRVMPLNGLRERCWGALEQGPIIHPMPYLNPPNDAEPWDEFVARIVETLNSVLMRYDNPVVFAHSGVFRAIRYLTLGTHEGPSAVNAQPMQVIPPDDEYSLWQLVPLAQSE